MFLISKSTIRETLACAPVILNQVLIGLGWGWTAPMLMKLLDGSSVMSVNQEQASWIASLHDVGRVTGPFIAPFLVDRIGRRNSVVLVSVLLFLIWPGQIYMRNVYLLYLIRFGFGITNGISDVVSAVYVTENCSTNFRPVMGAAASVTFAVGTFIEFIIASNLTYKGTAIVNAIISVCTFTTLYFCIETPSFLLLSGRQDEAIKNLIWLRGDLNTKEISVELEKLKINVQEEKDKRKSLRTLFSSAANVKSLSIVFTMYFLLMMTGGSATGPYALVIFQPSKNISVNQFMLLSNVVHFVCIMISLLVISRVSRRKLIFIGFLFIGLSQMCCALLFYFHNRHYEIAYYPWLIFASMTLYGAFVAISSPAVFVIRTEILPLSVRSIGSSTAVITSAVVGFCATKSFQPVTARFGMEANFFVYAFMGILMSVVVFLMVPETHGKTLDEIQELLEKKRKTKLDAAGSKDKNPS